MGCLTFKCSALATADVPAQGRTGLALRRSRRGLGGLAERTPALTASVLRSACALVSTRERDRYRCNRVLDLPSPSGRLRRPVAHRFRTLRAMPGLRSRSLLVPSRPTKGRAEPPPCGALASDVKGMGSVHGRRSCLISWHRLSGHLGCASANLAAPSWNMSCKKPSKPPSTPNSAGRAARSSNRADAHPTGGASASPRCWQR